MFCSKCGAQMPDGARFCPICGHDSLQANSHAGASSHASGQTAYTSRTTYANVPPAPRMSTVPILVFGILSLYLSMIFGIIFGKIAQNKAEEYRQITGRELDSIGNVGYTLGRVGFYVGIGTTIAFAIFVTAYIIIFVGLLIAGVGFYL